MAAARTGFFTGVHVTADTFSSSVGDSKNHHHTHVNTPNPKNITRMNLKEVFRLCNLADTEYSETMEERALNPSDEVP